MTAARHPRIAIYARYSSDLQNPSSVDDQVALCRKVIADQFRPADPEKVLVFSDAAISGATMERPGLKRLLAAVGAGRVDLVLAEGLDRLSRSLKDIAALHETLGYHGAGIWTAHEGRITELHVGLKGTMNALFLRDMKAKIKRGQSARIAAGFAASSCAYGYRVVRGVVDEKGRNVNGVREIDEDQARTVRRIYDEYAAGRKITAIIEDLNRDGIPAPAGGLWKRNAIAGSPNRQEGVLYNEIYVGRLVYNRTRIVRDPSTGRRRYVVNPESEWTRTFVPELRIIDEKLWAHVQARLRKTDRPAPEPKRRLPATMKVHNQRALTGWVKCGWCGGPKSLANETRYLCSTHRYAKKCRNSRGTKEPVLMAAVLGEFQARIDGEVDFTPAFARAFARESRRRANLVKSEADVRARIDRLLGAVERGVNEDAVTDRILALQGDLERIREELHQGIVADLPPEEEIRARLTRAVSEIGKADDVPRTRLMFERLLREVVLTPIPGQPRGETIQITLREEGWPEFWRMIVEGPE
ncbi:MAG: recombinase family protein [Pseudomonadota bacterium]